MADNGIEVPHALATLEHIVKSVVEKPDQVQISITSSDDVVSMAVTVGDGDMGRVIGRRGRIANAIRTVVQAAAVRDGVNVAVEFVD
ncbi:MAG: KH domain-containing protein [Actinomycetota bacterium]|nr:KH domain-containing protein [Actinomycetota bacterium]